MAKFGAKFHDTIIKSKISKLNSFYQNCNYISRLKTRGNYGKFDKTLLRLFPNFTIWYLNLKFRCFFLRKESFHFRQRSLSVIICNGNRTEWRPIQSVIIRVITNSDDRAARAGFLFLYHEYDWPFRNSAGNWVEFQILTNR